MTLTLHLRKLRLQRQHTSQRMLVTLGGLLVHVRFEMDRQMPAQCSLDPPSSPVLGILQRLRMAGGHDSKVKYALLVIYHGLATH